MVWNKNPKAQSHAGRKCLLICPRCHNLVLNTATVLLLVMALALFLGSLFRQTFPAVAWGMIS